MGFKREAQFTMVYLLGEFLVANRGFVCKVKSK